MQVFVYFNLRTKLWSVASVKGNGRDKLIRHARSVALSHCRFVVSEATRLTVLRIGERNVHAGVIGTIAESVEPPPHARAVTYNPHRGGTFTYRDTGEPVTSASRVAFGASPYPLAW